MELKRQFPESMQHEIRQSSAYERGFDVVFLLHDALNLIIDDPHTHTVLITSTASTTLQSKAGQYNVSFICGMNLFSGFIGAPIKEVCGDAASLIRFKMLAEYFKWEYKIVPDTPGMIALRVLSMIINEAVATLAEGTANVSDIDNGMMLGTNYPKGPLRWCEDIGVSNVVDTLSNLYQFYADERYRVHPLLYEMATYDKRFYSSNTIKQAP